MDWIHLAQDRGQWSGPCEDGNKPSVTEQLVASQEGFNSKELIS
jgi:hypothetical protein